MKIKVNKQALYDYEVLKDFEAGIVLEGWEVKSIKAGNFDLAGSFVVIQRGQVWLRGMTVANWPAAKVRSDEYRRRDRALLLNKQEIQKIVAMRKQSSRSTIMPLEVYLQNNLIKVRIGVVRSRRQYQKRELKKRRDLERDIKRDLVTT